MVDERHALSVGRDPDVADPPFGLVQDLLDRVLEPVPPLDGAAHRELAAVGGEVRILDVGQDLPRRASDERDAREGPSRLETVDELPVERDRELARRRDGEDVSGRQVERARLGALRPHRLEPEGLSLPARSVDDRLAVGREARREDEAAPERELPVGRNARPRRAAPRAPGEPGGTERREREDGRHACPYEPHARSRNRAPAGARRPREALPVLAELEREVGCRLEPVVRVLVEASLQDRLELLRNRRGVLEAAERVFRERRAERLDGGGPPEGHLPRQHLEEESSEGEDVGAVVDRRPANLLRRHVPHRSDDDARDREAGGGLGLLQPFEGDGCLRLHELGEAEVEELHPPVARQEDVLGLQVAVDDAGGVSGREALRDLDRGGGDDLDGERPAVEPVPERLPLEELGDEVGDPVVAPDVEDGEDVRVVEPPDRLHLDLEPANPVGVGGPGPREDLDGDVAAEPGVPGAPDLAHSPRADARHHFVGTELVSRRECHRTWNGIAARPLQRTRRTVQKSHARSGWRR